MRGELSVDLDARVAPPESASPRAAESSGAQWSISGVARLTGIHGWKLPERRHRSRGEYFRGGRLALGRSVARKFGNCWLKWRVRICKGPAIWIGGAVSIRSCTSSHRPSDLNDVLSWYRALHPDVAEDLRAQGALGVDVTLGGWPIELQQGAMAGAGGTLAAASLPAPLQIGAMNASVSRGGLDFAPTEVSFSRTSSEGAGETNARQQSRPPVHSCCAARSFPKPTGVIRWPLNWNFSIEGSTPRASGLAGSFRNARPTIEYRMDRGGRPCGQDARNPPDGIARSRLAGHDGFSRAHRESGVSEPAGALAQGARRIYARCSEPLRCPRPRRWARLAWHDVAEMLPQFRRVPRTQTRNGRSISPRIIWTPRNSTAGSGRAPGPDFWRASPALDGCCRPPAAGRGYRSSRRARPPSRRRNRNGADAL